MDDRTNLPPSDAPEAINKDVSGRFNTTHWSVVLQARQSNLPEANAALESLCQAYWYPLYVFCRRQGNNPADSEDLTQQFFAKFLERDSFAKATPDRGRFRNFLLTCFKNFLANENDRRMTEKRGGDVTMLSLDDTKFETHYLNESAHPASHECHYDQAWTLTLLGKVMKDLKTEYASAGKAAIFDSLQVFLTGGKGDTTYAKLGQELGMSESAIKMAVLRLRQRYGQLLRREIAHTLNDTSRVEDELRHLVATLARQ